MRFVVSGDSDPELESKHDPANQPASLKRVKHPQHVPTDVELPLRMEGPSVIRPAFVCVSSLTLDLGQLTIARMTSLLLFLCKTS